MIELEEPHCRLKSGGLLIERRRSDPLIEILIVAAPLHSQAESYAFPQNE
jgi:hypothetical protein